MNTCVNRQYGLYIQMVVESSLEHPYLMIVQTTWTPPKMGNTSPVKEVLFTFREHQLKILPVGVLVAYMWISKTFKTSEENREKYLIILEKWIIS